MEAPEDEADDSQAVEEVVFAELAAVKASRKRASQPKIADDDGFGDSRGKKSSTSIIKLIFRFTSPICQSTHYLSLSFVSKERTTDDGYPLYDVKELNIGLGGG